MQDILPSDVFIWQKVEAEASRIFGDYGYKELRPPILENTQVFTRSIGETSDIVEKEMYTFQDKGGRSLTMRPECTAPIVRCYVEKNLHTLPMPQKFFYSGPMFRYERPQKGRLRQFYQIGVEAFGIDEPHIDAEIISMLGRFLGSIGIEGLRFQINSIGCENCRPGYREALVGFFDSKLDGLCSDCVRRHEHNPLRILDCKVPGCTDLRKEAPLVVDFLCEGCRKHFNELKESLDTIGIPYVENPHMVRGLDYYTRTTFEVTSEHLGSQNAVAAGGRYDGLVKEFGGPPTPAIGFAIGMERLVSLVKIGADAEPKPDIFITSLGTDATRKAIMMAEELRAAGFWTELSYGNGSLKSQMRRADKFKAEYVLILGDDELKKGTIVWKRMKDGTSGEIPLDGVCSFFNKLRKS
jgi:histidyl-tRNA synthetase